MPVISVLMQHNDRGRSGANLNETILNTSNVNVNTFGKLFTHEVSGQVYAQPLYVPFVQIAGKGVHNAVFVVTMDNWVYAFDADNNGGANAAPLWVHHLENRPPVPAIFYRKGYQDIVGNIGILGTPVIDAGIGTSAADPSTGTLYLVLATWNPASQKDFKQLLYALDLANGQPRNLGGQLNPVEIAGSVPGVGYLNAGTAPKARVAANGDVVFDGNINGKPQSIKDGHKVPAGSQVEFNPMQQMQRPGLLLLDGILYIAFGSHGDFNPYHGWVLAYQAATLEQEGVFCTTPNGAQAGIWQAGEGLVADANGNVYVGTGNGDFRTNPGGVPDLGECFIRLKLGPVAAAGTGGAQRLALTGVLQAFSEGAHGDEDLGAASPTLLPDGRLVGGGKDGRFFLLDPAQMNPGGNPAALVQKFNASFDAQSLPGFTHHIHGSPVAWVSPEHGTLVYVWGENDVVRAYAYDATVGQFPNQPGPGGGQGVPIARGVRITSNDRRTTDSMPGAMLSLSGERHVNGSTTPGSGILWASFPPYDNANKQTVLGELCAYDASRFDAQGRIVAIWSSRQNPQRDHYGNFPKFCCPTIANGKVYQATFNQPGQVCVYGLLTTANGGYNLGFGGTTGLTLNGSTRVDHTHIRLTEVPHLFQASSVFHTNPVNVRTFQTIFRLLLTQPNADGLTFCIQGEGPQALGGPGGGLGYGPNPNDPNDPGFRITRSVAVKFDLFNNQTAQPASTTGLYFNGASPSGGDIDLAPSGIDLHSGHPFRVSIGYDGTMLSVTIKNESTNASASQQYAVDVPSVTGPMAFVGFTGATGGFTARQDILSWQFTS